MEELSNWGRWGDDDELGAANLMTEAKRREAAALIRTGTTVSLAHDLITEEAVDVTEPYVLQMRVNPEAQNSGDRIDIYFHGVTFSHLDGLCHVFYKDKVYNGFDFAEIVTEDGCSRMGTTAMKNGLVTRGILVDMPRLKGVPYLEPSTKLYREDIEAWEEQAGVTLGAGDALAAPHGSLGAPSRARAYPRDVGLGRVRDAVSGRTGHRAPRRRLRARGPGQRAGSRLQPHPQVRHRRAWDESSRQPGPRRSGRDRRQPQPLGIHARGRPTSRPGRHRFPCEPNRHFLIADDG